MSLKNKHINKEYETEEEEEAKLLLNLQSNQIFYDLWNY